MRTTRILAAGKTIRKSTPEDRLQRKMAARAAARAELTRSPAAAATKKTTSPPTTTLPNGSSRSRLLAAPMIAVKQGGDVIAPANIGVPIAATAAIVNTEIGGGTNAAQPLESDVGTQYCGVVTNISGGASVTCSVEESTSDRSPNTSHSYKNSKVNSNNNDPEGHNSVNHGHPPHQDGPTVVASDSYKATGTPDATSDGGTDVGRTAYRHQQNRSIGGNRCISSSEAEDTHPPPSQTRTLKPDDDYGNSSRSSPRRAHHPEDMLAEQEEILRGVREGPVRDALASLLTSTVMGEDGDRVLTPTVPSISALRELKYAGPMEPPQTSALGSVLFARFVRKQRGSLDL